MNRAIIDIGSNTAKAYIYDGYLKKISSHSVCLQLIKYVENGLLTETGRHALDDSVGILIRFLKENGADNIVVIATRALRSASNASDIIDAIQEKYSIIIRILSEKDEALCDFAAADFFSIAECNVVLDVGGGSSQLILSENGNPYFLQSYSLGAMELALKYGGCYPDKKTYKACCNYIQNIIENSLVKVKLNSQNKVIFAMGGSITCAISLLRKEGKNTKAIISLKELSQFAEDLLEMGERGYCKLKKETDGREISLLYGLASVLTTAEICGCSQVEILNCGVREGYLLRSNKGEMK